MTRSNIRVLIVDDSALIREMISDFVSEAPGIDVAGTARDGLEALDIFDRVKPDVVTLDIEMPRMNGLDTLRAILHRKPVPVIMVSSLTRLGADTTLEALDLGALDYVSKPRSGDEAESVLRDELMRKIRALASIDVRQVLEIRKKRKLKASLRRTEQAAAQIIPEPTDTAVQYQDQCIAIGISTGGPPALANLFETIRPPMPPIVVVQHMPADFTKAFAWRLDTLSGLSIQEAQTGDVLKENQVYVAPGGKHLYLRKRADQVETWIRSGEPVSGHKPSADVMMKCAAEIYGNRCLGVLMTGMGRDGVDGCGLIRKAGGYVLGQDEQSSDVYGMNKVAFVEGNVDRQFNLDEAATMLSLQAKRMWSKAPAGAR